MTRNNRKNRSFPVFNQTRGQSIGQQIEWADYMSVQMQGRIGSPPFPAEGGMMVRGGRVAYLDGFRGAVDVLFLTPEREVVACYPALPPGERTALHPDAYYLLELPEGVIERTDTRIGDHLSWEDRPTT